MVQVILNNLEYGCTILHGNTCVLATQIQFCISGLLLLYYKYMAIFLKSE